ncbi:MAG: bifunctional DNA-formamidopyrimidine glycosylase/DNA-(apurinic or apyrimidinic site) lyase [Syntrophomonadaceae bacterium]|nr:bifunctional DNA-formamidopyrimidine glycosylase/DNA-(apurinic or apyrimidinic site) lyase [Syntrophomonadaceae bacterium]
MPELPEIETIRTTLETIIGAGITSLEVNRADIIKREDFPARELCGQTVKAIKRRGKYLVLELGNGSNLVVHLGMSGRFYMLPEAEAVNAPHLHFIVHLDNAIKLVYQDARRFGGIRFCHETETLFAHMGVEPLDRQFTAEYLAQICRKRQAPIKNLLLNQNLISGIGNIYADESLFKAGIRGSRPAGSLTPMEIKRLHQAIKKVLRQSIQERGTTFRDFRDGYNKSGNFQNSLQVYGKANQLCPVCGGVINKEIIGGRSSHYCERCQK